MNPTPKISTDVTLLLTLPLFFLAMSISACSFSPSELYTTTLKNATTWNAGWDAALAPISCNNLHFDKPFWHVTGPLVVDGIDYSDSALSDPAAGEAVDRKHDRHIGPDC